MPVTKANALTALRVRATNVPGDYSDGNGLTLRVEKTGTKRWVQRVSIGGKQRNIGLGGHPAISLAAARDAAIANLQAIKTGRDVIAERKEVREAARQPKLTVPTFAEEAAAVIAMRRPTWSNQKHADQWESTLATYAFPVIGTKTVDEITPFDALAVLEPIWTAKPETASRVRQRMETVMDWAVTHGYRLDNLAGRALLKVLPRVNREQNHYKALPYSQVGWAVSRVRESNSHLLTKLAFEFLVLTAARSGEVRKANWGEILWERCTWEVPAVEMKARRYHRVPLSDRAMEILYEAWPVSGPEGLVFPIEPGGGVVSDMTYNVMMRRLGIPAVPHGFRSSFTDWVDEQHSGHAAAADKALAHEEKNKTRRAYRRSDLFEMRIVLMQEWADYVAGTSRPQRQLHSLGPAPWQPDENP